MAAEGKGTALSVQGRGTELGVAVFECRPSIPDGDEEEVLMTVAPAFFELGLGTSYSLVESWL